MLQHTNTAETMESFQLSGRSTEKKGERCVETGPPLLGFIDGWLD